MRLILRTYLTSVRHMPIRQLVMSFSSLIHPEMRKSGNLKLVVQTMQLAKRRAAYNKGFALRKALLGTSSTVNTEIPNNKMSCYQTQGLR